ncbi:hypothetical protein AVEN_263915-1 [Araneus ventricosus]|uniref:Uncharacterized protein n=1 Tax=Araneus ventricosus TaxID=182803 RepID=A0A4Y2FR42_ARAVE|nr:hypothetical protein AVEN_263915-1 [Araneus ventricosus]
MVQPFVIGVEVTQPHTTIIPTGKREPAYLSGGFSPVNYVPPMGGRGEVLGSRVHVERRSAGISRSRVMRTIAAGSLPIRNLPT